MKKSNKENLMIIGIVVVPLALVLLGIATEILKFVALVKWVFA